MDRASMWARLLESKYKMPSVCGPILKPGSHTSLIWRSMCWSRDLFLKGLGRSVFNGLSTNFWFDRWLGDASLIQAACSQPPAHLLNLSVRDFWQAQSGWKWHDCTIFISYHFVTAGCDHSYGGGGGRG